MRGLGRLEALETPGSFRVVCGCSEVELRRVEGAAETLWSYHLRHARGGLHMTCPACGAVYALAGRVEGRGLPDVVDLARVDLERCSALPRWALLLFDVANQRDDAVWERSAEAIRQALRLASLDEDEARRVGWELRAFLRVDYQAALAGGPVHHAELAEEARRCREWLQHAKQRELAVIGWEAFGIDGWPAGARIFRTAEGGGYVDWGSPEAKPGRARRAEELSGAELLEQVLATTVEAEVASPAWAKPLVLERANGARA